MRIGLILVTLFMHASLFANITLDTIFEEVSVKYKVPTNLLRAICWAESGHVHTAYNHQDGGKNNSSFGICQILYSTVKNHGFADTKCENNFNDKSVRTYNNCKLFDTRINIIWAAKELKRQLIRYDNSWINAIAAYNTGSIVICKTGYLNRQRDGKHIARCKIGGYINQGYIDRVLKALDEGR